MPLIPGNSPDVISKNIKTLVHEGRERKQAVAIALSHAEKYKKQSKKSYPVSQALQKQAKQNETLT